MGKVSLLLKTLGKLILYVVLSCSLHDREISLQSGAI